MKIKAPFKVLKYERKSYTLYLVISSVSRQQIVVQK